MKDQVKKFGQYIKEQRDPMPRRKGMFRSKDAGNGIAVWQISDYNSQVIFGDDAITIDSDDADYDEEGNFLGMRKVFSAAAELGASPDMIWSTEDSKLLFRNEMPH